MQYTPQPSMFYGAKYYMFERAKFLRENMTEAEKLLWSRLRNKQLGVRFRNQHPIDIFIADFYCHSHKLIIEVDGEYHEERSEYDIGRTAELEKWDITVIRFSNDEIKKDIERVIGTIKKYLY